MLERRILEATVHEHAYIGDIVLRDDDGTYYPATLSDTVDFNFPDCAWYIGNNRISDRFNFEEDDE